MKKYDNTPKKNAKNVCENIVVIKEEWLCYLSTGPDQTRNIEIKLKKVI